MTAPTAAEILARTTHVYATCRSYQDEGEQRAITVDTYFTRSRRHRSNSFRNAFVRPSSMRVEHRDIEPTVSLIPARGAV